MEKDKQYIVSARKYRPQTFDTIVGQEHVTNTLKNAILTQQIAQAYLFYGPRGVGKTTCARVFAKTINCLNIRADGEACNECTSCKAFNSNTSFNIYELDAASNNSVEDIRQLIDQVRYPPQIGKYKVYIIDEVHMLSAAAFNAFLKTLEEPPAYAKFILATTEKNKVLPTILSRCQVFNFNRIKTENIARYLEKIAVKENHHFETEALRIIAQKADGGLRDACSIYDQMAAFTQGNITTAAVIENLHVLDYDYFFQLTENILTQNFTQIFLLLDKILSKGFDPQNILVGLMDHLRYLLLAKDPQTIALLDMSDAAKSAILEQSKKCSEKFLLNALAILNKADVHYKSSRHQRLHLEIHFLQIANLNKNIYDTEKKNLIDDSNNSKISEQNNNTNLKDNSHTKYIKYSDQPILNYAIVQTTVSLKEFTSNLSHQEHEKKQDHPALNLTEIHKSNLADQPINKNIISENNNISYSDTPPKNEQASSEIDTQNSSLNTHDEKIKENNSTINISDKPYINVTDKKYQTLLSKNPLLEELKIKLNLQFK